MANTNTKISQYTRRLHYFRQKIFKLMRIEHRGEELEICEFQGEFENIELFNGQLDRESLKIHFSGFSLQGKRVHKELTIFEKVGQKIVQVGKVDEVILFDMPPRYDTRTKKQLC